MLNINKKKVNLKNLYKTKIIKSCLINKIL